jgi:hypothetical protein
MRILEVDKLSTLPMSSDRKADGRSRTHLLHGGVRRHAERGIGKTHVALGIAWAIHVGAPFLRWRAPAPQAGSSLSQNRFLATIPIPFQKRIRIVLSERKN